MMTETSVTVTSSEGAPNQGGKVDGQGPGATWIRINATYFKTVPGIIKLVQLVSKPLQNRTGKRLEWDKSVTILEEMGGRSGFIFRENRSKTTPFLFPKWLFARQPHTNVLG